MFRAIIFDFFDVIRTDAYKSWLSKHGYKREGPFHIASERMDRGEIDSQQFLAELGKITGQPPAAILEDMEDGAQLDYDVVKLIEQLKANYKIGLLSNAPSAFLRGLLDEHDLTKYFDAVVVSSETGMIKPHPEIFHHTLDKLGVAASEAVFTDDNPANIEGAARVGIKGIVFTDADALRAELRELGVTL